MKNTAIIGLPLTGQLQRDIRRVSKETALSQADVMRQSIRLGLPQFAKRFPQPATNFSGPAGKQSAPAKNQI